MTEKAASPRLFWGEASMALGRYIGMFLGDPVGVNDLWVHADTWEKRNETLCGMLVGVRAYGTVGPPTTGPGIS